MTFRLSRFGELLTKPTGALELMDDLGHAMGGDRDVAMLGGGNPGKVPAVQRWLAGRLAEIAASESDLERMLLNYAHPRGEIKFRRALASLLREELGWRVTADNIALTAGSQTAFFMLFNLFAGVQSDDSRCRVLLPVTPEYVGYADVGVTADLLTARKPAIELLPDRFFKYHLNLEELYLADDVAAVCVSRPTNPTGNVLTDAEMDRLDDRCREAGVPLIVDNAYGAPFPNILFVDAEPRWHDNIVFCMSLSKLGLPSVRTGIVVAAEEIVDALSRVTAVMSLAVGSVGPVIAQPMVESGEILELSRREIRPFYERKAWLAAELLARELEGLPFRIHQPEGAIFLWLWLEGLPISSAELYARLKREDVLVLSGHHFFPGLADDWTHKDECLRISYAQDSEIVERGIRLLAREVRRVYDDPRSGASDSAAR
jgi:valine--pyruvate aminotransferase